ncbi:MAG TPA: hypothetical protein VIV60_30565 [Polyangiaceae bacterium]
MNEPNKDAKQEPLAPGNPSPPADANKDFAELASAEFEKGRETTPPAQTPAASSPAQSQEASPASSGVLNPNETGKEGEKPSQEKNEVEPPWHKDERFQTFLREKKEFDEAKTAALAAVQREQEFFTFMQQNGITPEQLRDTHETLALINTDPAKALERLQPLIQQLQRFNGEALPEDLQKSVENGELSLEHARRIAVAESKHKFTEQRGKQEHVTQTARAIHGALSNWEQQKLQSDPDYARKQMMVNRTFTALSATQPWQTPEQAVALAEKAYAEVNTWMGGFVPKPKATPPSPSQSSPTGQMAEPEKWDDVDGYIARKLGAA